MSKEKFSMTWTMNNFEKDSDQDSPVQEHFGWNWQLHAQKSNANLSIQMLADEKVGGRKNRIFAECSLFFMTPRETMIGRGEIVRMSGSGYHRITVLDKKTSFDGALRNHRVDNAVTIRCDVTVEKRLVPKTLDFETPSDVIVSDFTLVVENRKFRVSKMLLASFSTYFRTMFENVKDSEDPVLSLEQVDADDFQELLEVLYHQTSVTMDNARELLGLVTQFKTHNIKNKCDKCLVNSSDSIVPLKEKLNLADKYELPELLTKCSLGFTTIKQLTDAVPNKGVDFKLETLRNLFQRVCDLQN